MKNPSKAGKKQWVKPNIIIYGDMATLTRQCNPPGCKPKVMGMGDDFATNISTVSFTPRGRGRGRGW